MFYHVSKYHTRFKITYINLLRYFLVVKQLLKENQSEKIKKREAEPIIAESDRALESGSSEKLIKDVTDAVAEGIRERFIHARETKRHADENVEAGREFVEAYVEFTHFVERLYLDAAGNSAHLSSDRGNPEKHHYQ